MIPPHVAKDTGIHTCTKFSFLSIPLHIRTFSVTHIQRVQSGPEDTRPPRSRQGAVTRTPPPPNRTAPGSLIRVMVTTDGEHPTVPRIMRAVLAPQKTAINYCPEGGKLEADAACV